MSEVTQTMQAPEINGSSATNGFMDTQENQFMKGIEESFTFIEMTEEQKNKQKAIYEGAKVFARSICLNVKQGAMQMEAIQNVCRAVMSANQSIQFEK